MSILSNNNAIEDIKCWVNNNSSDIEYVYTQDGKLVFSKYTEIEDSPPLLYNSKKNNLALKNYRIYGNTINGESVGDRTENLWDEDYENTPQNLPLYKPLYVGDGEFTLSTTAPLNLNNAANIFIIAGNVTTGASTATTGVWFEHPHTVSAVDGYITIAFRSQYGVNPIDYKTMLNFGSTTLPYEPYGYRVPVTVTNGTDTQTTNLYLPEQIKKVGDEAEYVDFGEQKHHKVRKNLLQNTAVTQTKNGVTFTINDDGSVTCNGTPTQEKPTYIVLNVPEFEDGQYILSGCPAGGGANSYFLRIYKPGPNLLGGGTRNDYGNGGTFTYGNHTEDTSVNLFVAYGYVCENITFYPMIRKSNIEDNTYEQYIENTELDVTLPALSTLSGTNTLSVGTNIQPSSVYLKGKI